MHLTFYWTDIQKTQFFTISITVLYEHFRTILEMAKTIRQVIKLRSATVLTKIGFQVQFEHLLTRPGRNDLQFLL